jgi:hypothetical protein
VLVASDACQKIMGNVDDLSYPTLWQPNSTRMPLVNTLACMQLAGIRSIIDRGMSVRRMRSRLACIN